ncbi:ABC transporter substrate-binding protein [Zafaria sp. Z1313]|uniref:ABC transporter substrate-binding protein n=1 Tax=Zafaria sp. Z1313 TaxID=3423202 RepID=UPI003D301F51
MLFSSRPSRASATLASAAAAALLLAGCASGGTTGSTGGGSAAPDAGDPVSGGTLVYASGDAEPDCLDPHVRGNYPQALLAGQFLETLFTKDADGEIVPWLAEGADVSDDGLEVVLTLREGIEFTDGTPLDAAAVWANIEHLKDPDTGSSTGYLAVGKIAEGTVEDARTLRLRLSAPDAALLESFSQPWVAIQSPAGIGRGQEENCAAPIGTGPFQVASWTRQDRVELIRNEDYTPPAEGAGHEGPAYLDGISWRFIPEAATRQSALQSGTVHVIDNPQPDAIAAAEASGALGHLDAPRPGASNRIELNTSKAPFDDPAVREAFVKSVDVDAGVESLFFGTARRSYSPLSSVEPMGHGDPAPFGVDTARAAELLDAAGWDERDAEGYRSKDGQRLSLEFPVSTNQSVPAEQSLFQQLQAAAKEAGFEVKLNLLDLSSWYGALFANDYDLVSAPYTKVGPDVLRILFHSDSTIPAPSGYFANLSQVKDAELDRLLTEAGEEADPTARAALYDQAQAFILAGHYILPLYDQQNHFLHSTSLQGVGATTAVASPVFHDVWIAE